MGLGSGLLLDVPLAELAGMFQEVVLMDVVCLPEIRKQIRLYRNVAFLEHDATGVAERLAENRRRGSMALPDPETSTTAYDGAGLLVSLNILSQLWVVPRAFIGKHLPGIPPEPVDDLCSRIVEAHYSVLRRLSCDVCLVGDYGFVKRDRSGAVISRGSTVYDLALPAPLDSWTWNIVPIGKDSPHASKELLVGGWRFGKN